MITQKQLEIFRSYPVIAAVRTPSDFEKALESKVNVFFMVGGDFFKAKEQIKKVKDKGGLLLLHMDLIEGIGRDHGGICFAVEHGGIDGIISTKSQIIKIAAKENLITVHRIFLMDNQALESGYNLFKASKPDIIELTPGLIPRVVRKVSGDFKQPVITSGLITKESDVKTMIQAGAMNIVCSCQNIWSL